MVGVLKYATLCRAEPEQMDHTITQHEMIDHVLEKLMRQCLMLLVQAVVSG